MFRLYPIKAHHQLGHWLRNSNRACDPDPRIGSAGRFTGPISSSCRAIANRSVMPAMKSPMVRSARLSLSLLCQMSGKRAGWRGTQRRGPTRRVRFDPHRLQLRQIVEAGIEEHLRSRSSRASSGENPANGCRPNGRPRSFAHRLPDPSLGLGEQSATMWPIMSRTSARCLFSIETCGMPFSDRVPQALDQRKLNQLLEVQQSGSQSVVDVVIVVGDVVGDCGNLRFEARPACKLQIPVGVRLGHGPSRVRNGPVVLGETLERFPTEIQAIEVRIWRLQLRYDPNVWAL